MVCKASSLASIQNMRTATSLHFGRARNLHRMPASGVQDQHGPQLHKDSNTRRVTQVHIAYLGMTHDAAALD